MSQARRPPFDLIPKIRVAYNVGAMFDVPTGSYEIGIHGESILNGGMLPGVGIVGIGNNFKSAIGDFLQFTVMSRFSQHIHIFGIKYDTEMNVTESRQQQLAENVEGLSGNNNPILTGKWIVSDKARYYGNEWFEIYKAYVKDKIKNSKDYLITTPFVGRDGKQMQILLPTPTTIDSLTKFETQDVADTKDEHELGDSGANTIHMRSGLVKSRLIDEMVTLSARGNTPVVLTAHIGKLIPMDARAAPVKKLQYLKNNDQIKGVTDAFTFLTHICWQASNAAPLMNDLTKAPEYPDGPQDDMKGDTDLNEVTLTILRNKYGRSGLVMKIIVSQTEGVLPSLSEFHYIKTNVQKETKMGWGLDGNVQNYTLTLAPDVKLSRTAIRPKIKENANLRRALTITSEMLQIKMLWIDKENLFCTPKELYDDLIAIGYDWDTLLSTRGYWLADNDSPKHEKQFLSTMDLLRMRKGLYVPYWWPKDKKLDMSKVKA